MTGQQRGWGKLSYIGSIIAAATGTPGTPITVGREPQSIAITPDGKTAYAVSWQAGTVTPISTATSTPGRPIHVSRGAFTIVMPR